jgi:RNA polymerase sigma factor (sigma-70 family)
VTRYCRRHGARLGIEHDELLQRVRLRAWLGHATYNGTGAAGYLSWTLRIAHNQAIDLARSLARRRDVGIDDLDDLAAQRVASAAQDPRSTPDHAKEIAAILARACKAGALSRLEVAVLTARFNGDEDLGWRAIGPRLGISEANAAQMHLRAIAKLRTHLFIAMPDALGGVEAIGRAFEACLRDGPRGGGPSLTDAEAAAFAQAILKRGAPTAAAGTPSAALRSACQKVVRRLSSPL